MFEIITYLLFGEGQKDIVGTWSTGQGDAVNIKCEGEKLFGTRTSQKYSENVSNNPALELVSSKIKNMWEGTYIDISGLEYFCVLHWVKGSLVANLESKDGSASKTKHWKRIK